MARHHQRVVVEDRSVTPEWPRVVDLLHRSAGWVLLLSLWQCFIPLSTFMFLLCTGRLGTSKDRNTSDSELPMEPVLYLF